MNNNPFNGEPTNTPDNTEIYPEDGMNEMYLLFVPLYIFLSWFLLGATTESFIITLIVYTVSIAVAFSPLGEMILRVLNNVRPIETEREKEYLLPLFEDVYNSVKEKYPDIRKDIQLYIVDELAVNAYAMGRKTIAVTIGAIEALSEDELKGIIAHEFAHIYCKDTYDTLLCTVGNGIFSVVTMAVRIFMIILETIADAVEEMKIMSIFILFIRIIGEGVLFFTLYTGEALLAWNKRRSEYRSDRFAYEVGYGDDLKEALYLLQKMSMSDKSNLTEKLKSTHPRTSKRIMKLEMMLDRESAEEHSGENE